MNRRHFLKASSLGIFSASSVKGSNKLTLTPREIEGPFYPVIAQKDKDFDLTKIKGREQHALGEHIFIVGTVTNTEGQPIENATVDLWQANAAGRYSHPHDSNTAPLDENFQGWAIVPSGKNGEFKFKTVFPGAYPANKGWIRPPHIHFRITKNGYEELITQMYFPEHSLNKDDKLLQRKSAVEQKLMIAEKSLETPNTYHYRIVIQKV